MSETGQIWIGGSAACDIIITISMVYFVRGWISILRIRCR